MRIGGATGRGRRSNTTVAVAGGGAGRAKKTKKLPAEFARQSTAPPQSAVVTLEGRRGPKGWLSRPPSRRPTTLAPRSRPHGAASHDPDPGRALGRDPMSSPGRAGLPGRGSRKLPAPREPDGGLPAEPSPITGDPGPLAWEVLDLTSYRIVQEALANVRRHFRRRRTSEGGVASPKARGPPGR